MWSLEICFDVFFFFFPVFYDFVVIYAFLEFSKFLCVFQFSNMSFALWEGNSNSGNSIIGIKSRLRTA